MRFEDKHLQCDPNPVIGTNCNTALITLRNVLKRRLNRLYSLYYLLVSIRNQNTFLSNSIFVKYVLFADLIDFVGDCQGTLGPLCGLL